MYSLLRILPRIKMVGVGEKERERERDDMIVVQLTQNPTQNNIGVYMCRRGRKLYEKSNQNMDDRFTVI